MIRAMRACNLIALLLLAALAAEAAATRRLALMVGVNDGGRDRVRLKYAGSDALAFAHSMRELGGVAPQDVFMALEADSAGLAAALDQLAARAAEARLGNPRIEAVIFYSGHADEQGLLLKGRRFGFREFRGKVDGIPADVRIAIVDACASGALTKLKGGRTQPAFLSDQSSHASGYAFLTSSADDEAAQESDRIRASYFSHFLITGLRGAADASRDGRVTLHEAYQYAYHETLARTENTAGGPQHAGYDMRITGSGDVVMTELGRAQSTLSLSGDSQGRFFIRDDHDRLVAEVQKPAGHPMVFALEPNSYRARWHQSGGVYEQSFTLAKGSAQRLEPGPRWKRIAQEQAVSRGGDQPVDGAVSRFHPFHNDAPGEYRGTQISLFSNRIRGYFEGQQLSGVANQAGSELQGIQVTMGVNHARGPVRGGQMAFGINWASDVLRGVQISSGINYAGSMADALQVTGFLNIARGDGQGMQGATFLNAATNDLDGGQAAIFLNTVGGDLDGGHFAVGANLVRGDVRGAQISSINFAAGAVEGYQIGFLNVARSYRSGAPLGILNFVGDGVWRGDAWVDETGFAHLGLVSGTKHVNTRLALGSKTLSNRDLGSFSVEVAGHLPMRLAFLELGLMSTLIGSEGERASDDMPDFLQRLRLTTGLNLGRYVSLAGGLSWAAAVVPEGHRPWTDGNWMQTSSFGGRLHQWPGAHLSLRIGR